MNLWELKSTVYKWLRKAPVVKRIHSNEIEALRELLMVFNIEPGRALDLGTGLGAAIEVLNTSLPVYAMDCEYAMVSRAVQRQNIFRIVGSAYNLPFSDESIPFISMIGVTEYLFDINAALCEIVRCLNHSGFCLITINPPNLLNYSRLLTGHRLNLIREFTWENQISDLGLHILGKRKTIMQSAYLLKFSTLLKHSDPDVAGSYL